MGDKWSGGRLVAFIFGMLKLFTICMSFLRGVIGRATVGWFGKVLWVKFDAIWNGAKTMADEEEENERKNLWRASPHVVDLRRCLSRVQSIHYLSNTCEVSCARFDIFESQHVMLRGPLGADDRWANL